MRRALDYAKGLGVTLAQHCEDALPGRGRRHARGVRGRAGSASRACRPRPRRSMVARDIALVRLTGAPVHFLHLSTAGSVELVRRAKAEGLPGHRRGGAAPHAPHPRRGGRLRPGVQGEPAAAHRRGRGRGRGRACATARSTPSPPTTPRTRPRPRTSPSTRPRRACSGCRRRCPIAWQVLSPHLGPERLFALMSTQPAAIARLTATDARAGGHSAQGGPVEAGAAANLCVFDPAATTAVDPARLASRSRNTPYAGRTLHGRGAPHRAARRAGRDRRDGAAVTRGAAGDRDGPPHCW